MNEAEWLSSDDVGSMLEFLCGRRRIESGDARDSLTRSLHRFYLASCRGIWPLLTQEASRRGVELAEQFLDGKATAEQVRDYNWYTEGAAFFFDYADATTVGARTAATVGKPMAMPRLMRSNG